MWEIQVYAKHGGLKVFHILLLFILASGFQNAGQAADDLIRAQKNLNSKYFAVARSLKLELGREACPVGSEVVDYNLTSLPIYDVTPMPDSMRRSDQDMNVKYFSADELKTHKISIINGIFYDASQNVLNDEAKFLFVMDARGAIYVAKSEQSFILQHSSFMSGEPVAAAGELIIKHGKLIYASAESGHYTPTQHFMDQFVDQLHKRSVSYEFSLGDVNWSKKLEAAIRSDHFSKLISSFQALEDRAVADSVLRTRIPEINIETGVGTFKIKIRFDKKYFKKQIKTRLQEVKDIIIDSVCKDCSKKGIALIPNSETASVHLIFFNPTLK